MKTLAREEIEKIRKGFVSANGYVCGSDLNSLCDMALAYCDEKEKNETLGISTSKIVDLIKERDSLRTQLVHVEQLSNNLWKGLQFGEVQDDGTRITGEVLTLLKNKQWYKDQLASAQERVR